MELMKKALLITDNDGLKETEDLRGSLEKSCRSSYKTKLLSDPSLEELKNEIESFFTENNKGNVHLLIYLSGKSMDDSLAFIRIFLTDARYEQLIFFIDSPQKKSLSFTCENTAYIQGSKYTKYLIEALNSEKSGFHRDTLVDINDIYLYIFRKMSDSPQSNILSRSINSTGIMTLRDEETNCRKEIIQKREGWDIIRENETYSFFVLYLELDFDIEMYKIDQLWQDHIEKDLFDRTLIESTSWKKFFGNEFSKKRIYIAPVLKDNLPIVKSIFRIFLNKQIDHIRVTKKEIKTRYYFTTLELPYKIVDSSERLIPSCSNIYKLAENLDTDKLYFSKNVIELLPENLRRNLIPISHKSDLFTYTFNLIT